MSTPLQTNKELVTLVKTISDQYEWTYGTEDPVMARYRDSIRSFLNFVYETKFPEKKGRGDFMSYEEVEEYLFEKLSKENIVSVKAAHPEWAESEKVMIGNMEKDAARIKDKLLHLNKLALPANGHGVAMLHGLMNSVLKGIDNPNDPIVQALGELRDSVAKYSVHGHPDMPKIVPNYEDAMKSVIKTMRTGDDYFGTPEGFRLCINSLEQQPQLESGRTRQIHFATEAYADLAEQTLMSASKIKFVSFNAKTDAQFKAIETAAHLRARDLDKLGQATIRDVLLTTKVTQMIADKVNDTPDSKLEHYGVNEAVVDDIAAFRESINKVAENMTKLVSLNLEGYKKQWDKDRDLNRDSEVSMG